MQLKQDFCITRQPDKNAVCNLWLLTSCFPMQWSSSFHAKLLCVFNCNIDPLIALANTFAEENLETYFGALLVRISTMLLSFVESPA